MGKAKKDKLTKRNASSPYARGVHKSAVTKGSESKPKQPTAAQSQVPTIPFAQEDRILLIGEGDFSFAHSLLTHHGCTSLTATTLESPTDLLTKYPQAASYIADLESDGQQILYSIDATKLGSPRGGGGKALGKQSWDRIIFNFPHVGGLTKDVNRQVRANQELLVKFFEAAKPLLASQGTIVVTVFEGQPYELWNLRDLARHSGLKVGRSFSFQAAAYPGYKHARTLGNIEGGGGWKGADRAARTYCFEVPDGAEGGGGERRKKKESSDEEGDD